jgi:hypothetical protein
MNRSGRPLFLAVAALVLAGLLLGALWVIQPGGAGAAATATTIPTPAGYPAFDTPVPSTAPPLPTVDEAAVITLDEMTPLWFTPEPTLTATPSLEGSVFHDWLNRFSLILPAGWYAYAPIHDDGIVAGHSLIRNYDMRAVDTRPDWGVKAHVTVVSLEAGKTFEEWVAEQQQKITAPEFGAGAEISASSSAHLGIYNGISFTAQNPLDLNSKPVLGIYLRADDGRIIALDVSPANSQNAPALLSILDTISLDSTSDS